MKRSSDVIEYKEGGNPIILKGLGRTKYEPITLERGITQDTDFLVWADAAQKLDQGHASTSLKDLRREIRIQLLNEEGQAVATSCTAAGPGVQTCRSRRQRQRRVVEHQTGERGPEIDPSVVRCRRRRAGGPPCRRGGRHRAICAPGQRRHGDAAGANRPGGPAAVRIWRRRLPRVDAGAASDARRGRRRDRVGGADPDRSRRIPTAPAAGPRGRPDLQRPLLRRPARRAAYLSRSASRFPSHIIARDWRCHRVGAADDAPGVSTLRQRWRTTYPHCGFAC